MQALVARLIEGTGINANNGIISGVLITVGDLARVVGELRCYKLSCSLGGIKENREVLFYFILCVGLVGRNVSL